MKVLKKDDSFFSKINQSQVNRYYIKTLLGYCSQSKRGELFELNDKLFVKISPFLYLVGSFSVEELSIILDNFDRHFLILDKSLSFFENNLKPFGINTQNREHFLDFSFDEVNLNNLINSPPLHFKIVELTEDIFNNIRTEGIFSNHFTLFDHYQEFKKYGRAGLVMKGHQIVSIASTFCNYNNHVEIQVDTLKKYRGKGLATIACAKLLINIESANFTPHWDAATSQSKALGEKLGFSMPVSYKMYHKLDQENF